MLKLTKIDEFQNPHQHFWSKIKELPQDSQKLHKLKKMTVLQF